MLILSAIGMLGAGFLLGVLPGAAGRAGKFLARCLALAAVLALAEESAFYLFGPLQDWLVKYQFSLIFLQADPWSAAFLLFLGLTGTVVALAAFAPGGGDLSPGLLNLFILVAVLLVTAANIVTFVAFWVLLLVAALFLTKQGGLSAAAASRFLLLIRMGTVALVLAFYFLFREAGAMDFLSLAKAQAGGYNRYLVFAFALAAFSLQADILPVKEVRGGKVKAGGSLASAFKDLVLLGTALYGLGRFVFQFISCDHLVYGLLLTVLGLGGALRCGYRALRSREAHRVLNELHKSAGGLIFAMLGAGLFLLPLKGNAPTAIFFSGTLACLLTYGVGKLLLHLAWLKQQPKLGLLACLSLCGLPLTGGFTGWWLLFQSQATLTAVLLLPWPRLAAVLLALATGVVLALQVLSWFNFYRRGFMRLAADAEAKAAAPQRLSKRDWPAAVLAAAFLLLTGLVPLFLVLPLQKVMSLGGKFVPLSDWFGLVWGGSGHYAVFSPVVLLVFALIALGVAKLIEALAKGGDW